MSINRRIIAVISVAIVLATGAAPAWAGEFNVSTNGSYEQVPPAESGHTNSHLAPTAQIPAADSGHTNSYLAPTVVRVTAGGGFDWGDAGIGAAGGIAIAALLVGGGLGASQRRGSRMRHA